MKNNKKIVFLQIVDGNEDDRKKLIYLLRQHVSQYNFLVSPKKIESIPTEVIKSLLEDGKN